MGFSSANSQCYRQLCVRAKLVLREICRKLYFRRSEQTSSFVLRGEGWRGCLETKQQEGFYG